MSDPYRIPYASCPLCNCMSIRPLMVQDWSADPRYREPLCPKIHWVSCGACGHVFTDGYFSEQGLDILFQATSPDQSPALVASQSVEFFRNLWGVVLDRVGAYLPHGRWLDVGIGSGILLSVAREMGYQVEGTDLRAATAEAMKLRGFVVHRGSIEDVKGADLFDMVSMCDVLEHMPFPLRALAAAKRLLKPGRYLFVSLPNSDSPLWQAWDGEGANPYWAEIEHYHNFSRSRLYSLLESCGFRAERCWVSNRYRSCIDVLASN